MNNSHTAIEAKGLYFYYSTPKRVPIFRNFKFPLKKVILEKRVALNHVDIQIRANRITALLGRNGSGKTTLIKLITGARIPQKGTIKVFGVDPKEVRHKIGLFMGNTLIYHRLTARENLEYFGKLYGVGKLNQRICYLADLFKLGPHLDQMVESYSFGMKVKLALARAMIHSPELLILDEPTLGIDLELALQIREFIRTLKCSVLLTTHYMEEAQMLADDLCIIDEGKIIEHGERDALFRKYQSKSVSDVFTLLVSPRPVSSGERAEPSS